MTSKERVKRVINLERADKVPLGCYAIDCDIVEKIIGRKTFIRNKPGIKLALWEGRRKEVVDSLKQDCLDLFRKLDCLDIITYKEAQELPPADYEPEMPKKIGENTYEDRHGYVWKLVWETNEVVLLSKPVEENNILYTPDMFPMPSDEELNLPDISCYEVFDFIVENFKDERYILSPGGAGSSMPLLGGMENGLMQYALAPDAVAAAAKRNTMIANYQDKIAVRPHCDGVMIGQDMAGTNGLLISPSQWRQICKPLLNKRIKNLRQYTEQIILHSCGRTLDIMEDFIEIGINCYQSIQPTAGMDIELLCRNYGDKMAFWGGVPVELLIMGEPADIRREVKKVLEVTKEYPGFILGPSHSIAFGTKYENFMAMLDEFEKLR